jgi:ubiquinone/menaquinone biosynthesis C-methylase UbiE
MNTRTDQSEQLLQGNAIHSQWESDYLNPDMDAFYDLAFAEIMNKLAPKPSDSILDAGCGFGYHTVRIARGQAQITAVDFSEVALAMARETISGAGIAGRVTLQRADLTHLSFAENSFDFVISWGVIMHIPEVEAALSELARVLKPGGVLVLCENNVYSVDVQVRERVIRAVKRLFGRAVPELRHTPRGTESWTQSADGGLMVRKSNMRFFARFLASRGLRPISRVAGQFTEAYTNMPTRPLKRLIYSLNRFYFRRIRIPHFAMGNILYFRKTAGGGKDA